MSYKDKVKITILGATSTGKTTTLIRFLKNIYDGSMESTIGASFFTYTRDDIKYEFWDTAGSERYLSLIPIYYRGSDIIILMYDLNLMDSVNKLDYFINTISKNMINDYKIIVVGNKLDLIGSQPQINKSNSIFDLISVENDLQRIDKSNLFQEKIKKIKNDTKSIIINLATDNNIIIDADAFVYISSKTGQGFELFKNLIHTKVEILINIKNKKLLSETKPKKSIFLERFDEIFNLQSESKYKDFEIIIPENNDFFSPKSNFTDKIWNCIF